MSVVRKRRVTDRLVAFARTLRANGIPVGPGAVVAGPIRVGSDAAVSANSLVLRDVPERAVVLGVPARVISYEGSFTQIYYRDMAQDPQRRRALADPGTNAGTNAGPDTGKDTGTHGALP